MNIGTLVALATSADFTGAVESVSGAVFTVRFSTPVGHGWLRAEDLVELPAQKGEPMKKGTPVALKENPNLTGKVLSVDGEDVTFTYDDIGGADTRKRKELREISDLPAIPDKSWPPATLETKNQPT